MVVGSTVSRNWPSLLANRSIMMFYRAGGCVVIVVVQGAAVEFEVLFGGVREE